MRITRLYLRVADDGTGAATYARVRGYESMSDVDTGSDPSRWTRNFPVGCTGGQVIRRKLDC